MTPEMEKGRKGKKDAMEKGQVEGMEEVIGKRQARSPHRPSERHRARAAMNCWKDGAPRWGDLMKVYEEQVDSQ